MGVSITGLGSYIPEIAVNNEEFKNHSFFNLDGSQIDKDPDEIIEKFKAITGIEERRYAKDDQETSDIAAIAAERAIQDAGIDKESLDGIIMAHNFGNIPKGKVQTDILPSLASRIKYKLQIENPFCVAYDILFGCPGWIQGVIIAQNFIKAGDGKRFLVIGGETLSRVLDPHDRDSMIYADGAAASIVESSPDDNGQGILSTASMSFTKEQAYFLYYDKSHKKDIGHDTRYIKMHGSKIYEFALTQVPQAMKACLDKAKVDVSEVKKVIIHQANEKMDEAIIKRFFRLYGQKPPEGIMPMSIHKLGNSSVATVPTLFDLVSKGQLEGHELNKGDLVLLASVGAGMNINAITYRI